MTRGQHRMRATLTLAGTIIGAGIFGVPAMIGAWGVIPATIGFALLTATVLAVHLLFAEAVLAYKPDVRLTGFAHHWLGAGAAVIVGAALTLAVFGSNLAYIILGGEFFHALASAAGIHLSVLTWQVLFWVGGAITVMIGLKWVSKVEVFLVWILVTLLVFLIGAFFGRAEISIVWQLPQSFTFEPYGVFLYSLFGFSVIAELELLVRGNREDLKKSVVRGTLVAATLTYLFGVSAWLASAGALGRNAEDLLMILPPWLAIVLPAAGFVAVATSFVTTALDLGSMFRLDYHFPAWLASCVGLGVPIALLFLTERDFLSTIGLVGSVFTATIGIFVVFMGRAALIQTYGHAALLSPRWWWQEVAPIAIAALLLCGGILWLLL